jgi:S1-C subfamily serine protease
MRSRQRGNKISHHVFAILIYLVVCTVALADASINGYQNAIIAQSATDMRGIAGILSDNVQKSGFSIVENPANLDEDQITKTCTIEWSQHGALTQYCQLTVKDLLTRRVVAHSSEWSRLRVGIPACIVGSVENAWKALKYSGFDQQVYLENLRVLFPKRPIVSLDEKQIKAMALANPIEGIWADSENKYSMGIIKDPTQKYGDYIGIVLHSSTPIWSPGEIKMELRETATRNIFTANVYLGNKSRVGAEVLLDDGGGTLRYDTTRPDRTTASYSWVKEFPKISQQFGSYASEDAFGATRSLPLSMPKSSGSGAIVSTEGYVLTAAHVVTDANLIKVVTLLGTVSATVLSVDEANDLAVLKITGGPYVPLMVKTSRKIRLGQMVATIGFPNPEIQGFSPKVTRGEISSINGFTDDPREWQISVPVQPGNSGGPLLDENGNLIGVVESKLGLKAAEVTSDLPQNVGYAVKSAYALALLDPYLDNGAPGANPPPQKESFEDMVAKAQQSVVLILVY